MIWFNFDKWSHSAGSLFCMNRVYKDETKWTPLVKISFRYVG
jgi:hypothetical protein